jgi:hypothetical protein
MFHFMDPSRTRRTRHPGRPRRPGVSILAVLPLLLLVACSGSSGSGSDCETFEKVLPPISLILSDVGFGVDIDLDTISTSVDSKDNVYVLSKFGLNVIRITPDGAITEIFDGFGEGLTFDHNLFSLAVDSQDNVYVAGGGRASIGDGLAFVFKIEADGTIAQIIDARTDFPLVLDEARFLAVDSNDNVYVVGTGDVSNVIRITPGGVVTEIIGRVNRLRFSAGTGAGDEPLGVAALFGLVVDSNDNVYVAGGASNNVFRITAPDTCSTNTTPCTITEIIDSAGDGMAGNELDRPNALVVDSNDNVYVSGRDSDNVFRITAPDNTCSTDTTPCTITEIIDSAGDGMAGNELDQPNPLVVDSNDNVYVSGRGSDNVFRITPGGAITEVIDGAGDLTGSFLDRPVALVVDSNDNVYVSGDTNLGFSSVFRITPGGDITEIINIGEGSSIDLAVDSNDNVYVSEESGVFRVPTVAVCP